MELINIGEAQQILVVWVSLNTWVYTLLQFNTMGGACFYYVETNFHEVAPLHLNDTCETKASPPVYGLSAVFLSLWNSVFWSHMYI